MALTDGTAFPPRVVKGPGGSASIQKLEVVLTASETLLDGSPVVFAADGDADEITNPTDSGSIAAGTGLVGLAKSAVGATDDRTIVIDRIDANTLCEASLVGASSVDRNGVAADIGLSYNLYIASNADGSTVWCIDQGDTTNPIALTYQWASLQPNASTLAAKPAATAGVGVSNPRVQFFFTSGRFV